MRMRWRRHLVVAAAGVAATLGWWTSESLRQPPVAETAPTALPDFFMTEMRARATDVHGRLRYRMHSSHVKHEPLSDVTMITAPELTLFREQGPPWTLRARTAIVHDEGARIELEGEVHARRPGAGAQPTMELRTPSMVLEPPRAFAHTEAAVEFSAGNHRLSGTGLRAWWDRRELTLLHNVKSLYVPH